VSTSPDGQLIAATGDAGNVGIYAVSSDRGYEQVALLRQVCEAGFSTSWDSASQQLAVAGQDGLVSVFDIRAIMAAGKFDDGLCRMARLESSQKGPKGAARCVKFSQTMSMDLLAFSEHCSFVNVFDARTFEKRQRIRLSQPNTDLHITGLDFSPDSQRLVIGLEQSLLEFDVNSLQRRSFASACFH
jgi:WD40 repeat protein